MKKNKVSFFNLNLIKKTSLLYFGTISVLETIHALLNSFHINIYELFVIILIFPIILFSLRYHYNRQKKITLKIGKSDIEIKEGNILANDVFENKKIIKVFAFNEYFDTLVDNQVISKSSLNGKFLDQKVPNISILNKRMYRSKRLEESLLCKNKKRKDGKQNKYKLGTVFKYSEDVFLTAMTHFDDKNRAYLSIQDYVMFLIKFWDEIDSMYAGRTVVITLFGSGITRLENKMFNNNQILQIILWTFWIRRIKFTKPAKFVILLDKQTSEEINYYTVREWFYGLQK